MKRPFAVTVLAVLAGIAGVLAIYHTLQALGIVPYMIGPIAVKGVNWWYALMWALMVWIWIWLVQMLWRLDPSAWLFLAAISTLNLIFITLESISSAFSDQSLSFLVNALILIYVLLPGTKAAFGIPQNKKK